MQIFVNSLKILVLTVLMAVLLPVTVGAADTRGKLTGGVLREPPTWFKESFLEIADDVDDASAAGKHVMLFFELSGCPYCDRMLEESFETEPLSSYTSAGVDRTFRISDNSFSVTEISALKAISRSPSVLIAIVSKFAWM